MRVKEWKCRTGHQVSVAEGNRRTGELIMMTGFEGSRPQAAPGMTLMEVLAAVMVLSMGLIMVFGAFPVGIDQTERMILQTDGGILARSAVGMLRARRELRDLPGSYFHRAAETTWPLGEDEEPWRVWNGHRWAYIDGVADRWAPRAYPSIGSWSSVDNTLWPPKTGDYIWRAFATRLSEDDEPPLFRVTIVVVRYNDQMPDLYEGQGGSVGGPFDTTSPSQIGGVRAIMVRYVRDRPEGWVLVGTSARSFVSEGWKPSDGAHMDRTVRPGDYVMDTHSGLCYRVSANTGSAITLADEPLPGQQLEVDQGGSLYYTFRNVAGIYYVLLS